MRNILIVGAGFAGCTIAEQLAKKLDCHIDIIDQRSHIGGNCHTERDKETGIMVHQYGPHIFHTNDKYIWDYVNRFGKFNVYTHHVKAIANGKSYSFPINLATLNQVFSSEWTSAEAESMVCLMRSQAFRNPANFEEQALSMIGEKLYKMFFYGYTKKQWGCEPKELPASILKRIPLRFNMDDRYHESTYSGIPADGYTAIMKKMIQHPNIHLHLNEKYRGADGYDHVFYTGPIDEYFDYSCGRLGYRTVTFDEKRNFKMSFDIDGKIEVLDSMGCAQTNFCDENIPFTRIVEHKLLAPWDKRDGNIVTVEYSKETGPDDIPFYPKRLPDDMKMLAQYQAIAGRISNVTFVGRLATYRYLDMHQVIGDAIGKAEYYLNSLKK